jgi:hypothetical protein
MSAAVTAGGAGAAGPTAGAAFDAVSVCAQAPAVNTASVRATNRVLVGFMEVQSSSLDFVFALLFAEHSLIAYHYYSYWHYIDLINIVSSYLKARF